MKPAHGMGYSVELPQNPKNPFTMGRRKKGRKTRHFLDFSHSRFVDDVIDHEQARKEQKKYVDKARIIEEDLLNRTIFVTNVKDLNRQENVANLRLFMETKYGRVDRCEKDKFTGGRKSAGRHFPPGRVTFATRAAAESVFGGKALRSSEPVRIICPSVGHRGYIRAMASRKYDGMLNQALTGNRIDFEAESLALGHWIPSFDDVYLDWVKESTDQLDDIKVKDSSYTEEFVEEISQAGPFVVRIDLTSRKIEIWSRADLGTLLRCKNHCLFFKAPIVAETLTVRFKELRNHLSFLVSSDEPGKVCLVFSTKWPPKLDDVDAENRKTRKTTFKNFPSVSVERCLGFKLTISRSALSMILSHKNNDRLRNFGVLSSSLRSPMECLTLRTIQIVHRLPSLQKKFTDDLCKLARCSPRIAFLAKSIIDSGRTSWYHALVDNYCPKSSRKISFVDILLLESNVAANLWAVERALECMMDSPVSECTAFPGKVFTSLSHEESDAIGKDETTPHYCVRIHKLLLTPTRLCCFGTAIELGNRVIRRFTEEYGFHPTAFLRVRIADENGAKLYGGEMSVDLEQRIQRVTAEGIVVNGDLYHFLAYSSSQLKEYSFWMIKVMKGWNVEEIRADLGDFSMCPNISKYAARIGQCFSATLRKDPSSKTELQRIKPRIVSDIASDLDDKVHSDGTGLISRVLMDQVLNNLPIVPPDVSAVSIIQIRYGGAKGTLSAWNHIRGSTIQLRPSMTKFETSFESVEVCSVGQNRPYFLNRNLILLLKSHAVPDQSFISIQKSMLNDMDGMLVSNEVARKMLPFLSGADPSVNNLLMSMLSFGVEPSKDPFLYGCLQSIRLHHIFTLRKKARLFIERGAVLMGGIDETGKVPEGCVYVQICKPAHQGRSREIDIIEGAVMVTKHPVMHPGDVRMLRAVNVPLLADHANVILFSQHGRRPEADKMSGSDLDGDEFAITWDTRLFLNEWNHCSESKRLGASVESLANANENPMEYEAPDTKRATAVPSNPSEYSSAMIGHLINVIKNDNLGRIAMLWQDYASRYGASCNACIRLAELHSIAVDFPKSGIPAELPQDLLLPNDFPVAHWREKKNADLTLHCTSVIGKLYDEVLGASRKQSGKLPAAVAGREFDKCGQVLCWRSNYTRYKHEGILDLWIPHTLGLLQLSDDVWKSRLTSEALSNRREFECDVLAVANKYGIRSEGELFTSCIRKFNKLQNKNQSVIAEECRRTVREICHNHRQIYFEIANELTMERGDFDQCYAEMDIDEVKSLVGCCDGSDWSKALRATAFQLAGAYYLVTYDESWNVDNRDRKVLYAFPWILADIIRDGLMEATGSVGQRSC